MNFPTNNDCNFFFQNWTDDLTKEMFNEFHYYWEARFKPHPFPETDIGQQWDDNGSEQDVNGTVPVQLEPEHGIGPETDIGQQSDDNGSEQSVNGTVPVQLEPEHGIGSETDIGQQSDDNGSEQSVNGIVPVPLEPEHGIRPETDIKYTYTRMNEMAITRSTSKWLMVEDIYKFYRKYPRFQNLSKREDAQWKSCVRHSLSTNKKKFIKKMFESNSTNGIPRQQRFLWGLRQTVKKQKEEKEKTMMEWEE